MEILGPMPNIQEIILKGIPESLTYYLLTTASLLALPQPFKSHFSVNLLHSHDFLSLVYAAPFSKSLLHSWE